jgi:hypothetical protein
VRHSDDPYLPGDETPAGQQIRLASGIAGWLRAPRRFVGFGGPMLLALTVLFLIVVVSLLVHEL